MQHDEGLGEKIKHVAEDLRHKTEDVVHKAEDAVQDAIHERMEHAHEEAERGMYTAGTLCAQPQGRCAVELCWPRSLQKGGQGWWRGGVVGVISRMPPALHSLFCQSLYLTCLTTQSDEPCPRENMADDEEALLEDASSDVADPERQRDLGSLRRALAEGEGQDVPRRQSRQYEAGSEEALLGKASSDLADSGRQQELEGLQRVAKEQ
ncbi:hypothetical protein ABPG77_010925 [Micractinium sp. CCAP 211/92]